MSLDPRHRRLFLDALRILLREAVEGQILPRFAEAAHDGASNVVDFETVAVNATVEEREPDVVLVVSLYLDEDGTDCTGTVNLHVKGDE